MTGKRATEPRPPPAMDKFRAGIGLGLDVLATSHDELSGWSKRKRKTATDTLRLISGVLGSMREVMDEARLRLAEGEFTHEAVALTSPGASPLRTISNQQRKPRL